MKKGKGKERKLMHTDFSDKFCIVPGCINKIKQRLVNNKPTIKYCYKHYDQLVLEPRRLNRPTQEELMIMREKRRLG